VALLAETVVGATAGCVPAVPGYSRRFPEISDRYRMHLVFDKSRRSTPPSASPA
jgi:adenosylmethionine-8-amino-7-oxononanoate aminotransferase